MNSLCMSADVKAASSGGNGCGLLVTIVVGVLLALLLFCFL